MARVQLFLKFAPLVLSYLFLSSKVSAQTQAMKSMPGGLRNAALLVLLILSPAVGRAQSQSLFFHPPTYPCAGLQTVAADLNQDGNLDLVCSDGTVLLGNGNGTFKTGTPLNLNGVKPILMATADFNGDGKPDMLLMGSSTFVLVFLGKGDGTFEQAVGTNTGTTLTALSAADVNGDGKADILALGSGGNSIALWEFLGKGDGTFAAGVQILNAATIVGPLLLGDFNGDGKVDVAIGSGQVSALTAIEILLGSGNGSFQPPVITALSNFTGGGVVVSGDFNGDHKLDLFLEAVPQGAPAEGITLLGNGDGTFQPPVVAIFSAQLNGSMFLGSLPLFAAADLNGDGKSDLVLQDSYQDSFIPFVEIFLSNGDGTFATGDSYFENGMLTYPYGSILIIDFNDDHKPDVAAINSVLIGNGDGSFHGNRALHAGSFVGPMFGTIGDFNGDGNPDLATISDQLYIFLNDGNGNLSLAHTYSGSSYAPGAIATTDLNGDGKLDLVFQGSVNSNTGLFTMLGNGDGSFGPANFFFYDPGNFAAESYLALADFNGDHKPDLAILANNELAVFLNNGNGVFEAPVYSFVGANPTSFVAGDFNNDGKVDVVVVSSAGIGFLLGNGDGTFKPPLFSIPGIYYAVWAAADLNHDGNLDLVAPTYNGQHLLSILLGKGDGTFTALPPTNLINGALNDTSLTVADVNGDGVPDLVWGFGLGGPAQVQVALGNGDGTFRNLIPIVSSPRTTGFTLVADLNHDGKPDLAVNIDNAVVTFPNTTQPGFTISATALSPASVPPGGSGTSTITVAAAGGFNAGVTLSCTSITVNGSAATTAPPTCSFNPTSITNGSGTSTLTVSTIATSALLHPPAMHRSSFFYALWLPICGLALIGAGFSPGSRKKKLLGMLLLGLMLSGLIFPAGCGGGGSQGGDGGSGGTPAGTYTITVKGTVSSTMSTTTLTLVVQ
jgi:hypothetical protein